MPEISAYQEAPYQGVSQAPPQVRRRDQADALEDCIVAIPSGLQKRPPFQWVGALAGHPGNALGVFHRVERSAGDAIYTITREGSVTVPRVYLLSTLAAQALTVDAAAQTYLNSGVTTPQHDIGCNTIVDYTFTWNRTKNVVNDGTTNPTRPHEAMVWIRAGQYGRSYSVTVNGFTVTLHTPDGTSVADASWVDAEKITTGLATGVYTAADGATISGSLVGGLGGPPFAVNTYSDIIYITNSSADFTIDGKDGQGGLAMVVIKDQVQRFSDLPKEAPDGFTVRIIQQSGTNQDDYYVKYDKASKTWEECLAPGAQLGLDKTTMPMGLVFDTGWHLKVVDWKQRATGNEELVRDPDFVGLPVQDLTFWQGRLGILAGEAITLSCADDPFQLYPRTLSIVLDSDPIGRANPASGETTFRYATPFERRLVLAGDTIQAEVTEDGILTPAKAIIDVMTQHEVSRLIRPAVVNGKLYMATPKGSASAITEISIDRFTNNPMGEDLSTAAFRYLPAGIDRSAICPVNYMALYGVSGTPDMYLHLFRFDNQDRVQNAFLRWHLPTGFTLGGMFFVNTTLYVLACKNGAGHVLKMDLSPLVLDADASSTIETFLDLKATEAQVVSKTYSAITGQTTVTLPYDRTPTTVLAVRAPGTGAYPEGYLPAVDYVASAAAGSTKLVVAGDLTAVPFYVGHKYESRWNLSRIYPLDGKEKPLRNGRCNLRRMTLDLATTGYVRAEVTAGGRPKQSYEFFGFNWDDPTAHFDQAPNATTRWAFPIMCENEQVSISIVNDSAFGHGVLGLEWLAEFNPRSQRT